MWTCGHVGCHRQMSSGYIWNRTASGDEELLESNMKSTVILEPKSHQELAIKSGLLESKQVLISKTGP